MRNPFKIREDAIALGAKKYREDNFTSDNTIHIPAGNPVTLGEIEFQDISSNPHFDLSGTAQEYYNLMGSATWSNNE